MAKDFIVRVGGVVVVVGEEMSGQKLVGIKATGEGLRESG